jgi:hypothetical protein
MDGGKVLKQGIDLVWLNHKDKRKHSLPETKKRKAEHVTPSSSKIKKTAPFPTSIPGDRAEASVLKEEYSNYVRALEETTWCTHISKYNQHALASR